MAIPTWLMPVIKRFGPLVWTWLLTNPKVLERIKLEGEKLLRASGPNSDAMRESLKAMREQVEYLRRSADDHAERVRADKWAASLTGLEHALELLGPGAPRADLKRLRERIDALRGQILDAFLIEQIEDAGGPAPIEPRGD